MGDEPAREFPGGKDVRVHEAKVLRSGHGLQVVEGLTVWHAGLGRDCPELQARTLVTELLQETPLWRQTAIGHQAKRAIRPL